MTLFQNSIIIFHQQLRLMKKINKRLKKFQPFGKNEIGLNIRSNSLVLIKILNNIWLRIWRMPRINSRITMLLILRNPARLNSYLTGFDNGKMTRKSTLIAKPEDRFFRRGGQYHEYAFCMLSASPEQAGFLNWFLDQQVSQADLACGLGVTLIIITKMRNI